ncbi:toxin HicA [Pantoea ananatis]|uniref:type II toxin-antitoxin system HicA family toxin n=1 Tax=Pantoea ananas TaxID=553 RepID=UPI0023508E28|nr:type II toxin-antitoxin system HicA family toxin [Pantoea ananatis]MDC7868818.1 toxin HicA [Pantoea ananatis]
MKSSELIKLLEKNGWQLERVKGSHHQFSHPEFSIVITVPHPKKDLKTGTVHQIMKAAKLK